MSLHLFCELRYSRDPQDHELACTCIQHVLEGERTGAAPGTLSILLTLKGDFHLFHGELDAAAEALEGALGQDPGNGMAMSRLLEVYELQETVLLRRKPPWPLQDQRALRKLGEKIDSLKRKLRPFLVSGREIKGGEHWSANVGGAESTTAWLEAALHLLRARDARQRGLLSFSTPLSHLDGLGDGLLNPSETGPVALGQRPTLQSNGQFLRVNSLHSQSCNECHSIVSSRTLPPSTGIAGVGRVVQDAIIMPSLMDVADSLDDRFQYVLGPGRDPDPASQIDCVADHNGRFTKPLLLYGGGTELLGKEMTEDLQRDLYLAEPTPFGWGTSTLDYDNDGGSAITYHGGDVQIDNQGVDDDLVVKPFCRKGDAFTFRDFDRGAVQFHFGIQPDEVVGKGVNADHHGVADEVTDAEMPARPIFDVNNPVPRYPAHAGTIHDLPQPATRSRKLASDSETRVAPEVASHRLLTVGIDSYGTGTGFKPLRYAVRDSERIAETFKRFGYSANHLIDQSATRKALLISLMNEVLASRSGDSFVFFYSGHGLVDREGETAIVTDAGADAVTLSEIGAILSYHRGSVVVVLDSCFRRSNIQVGGSLTADLWGPRPPTFITAAGLGDVAIESDKVDDGGVHLQLVQGSGRHQERRRCHRGDLKSGHRLQALAEETTLLTALQYGLSASP